MPKSERKRRARSIQRRLRLHFLGATQTVTGSLHFFEYSEGDRTVRFFLDAGLNQESESMNRQNRLPAGLKAADIDFGIFSHAHIDHAGFLPKLCKDGFQGKVYATAPTRDLVALLLPDSGYLQEEEAKRQTRKLARRRQQSDAASAAADAGLAKPAKVFQPLYTEADGIAAIAHIECVEFDKPFKITEGVVVRFVQAAHILGAAIVCLELGTGSKKRRVVFTGDLGRPDMPILQNVAAVKQADYLICEGTYGDKLHLHRNRQSVLADIINRAYERAKQADKKYGHGVIIIPAFAVGRVQAVLTDLRQLMADKRIPEMPVFVDSPMAIRATHIYRHYTQLYNKTASALVGGGTDPFTTPRYAELLDWTQSEQLDKPAAEPIIVVGSSGMASGGRIMRHLANRLPGKQNTVVFIGYQGIGTLGRQLVTPDVEEVRMNGEPLRVRATIEHMEDYSGHADYQEILAWLSAFQRRPNRVFLVHGEPESLAALKERIEQSLHWDVNIPRYRDYIDLD